MPHAQTTYIGIPESKVSEYETALEQGHVARNASMSLSVLSGEVQGPETLNNDRPLPRLNRQRLRFVSNEQVEFKRVLIRQSTTRRAPGMFDSVNEMLGIMYKALEVSRMYSERTGWAFGDISPNTIRWVEEEERHDHILGASNVRVYLLDVEEYPVLVRQGDGRRLVD